MTAERPEQPPIVPYTEPDLLRQEKTRTIVAGILLQAGLIGDQPAVYRAADHDGDGIFETTELEPSDSQVWELYSGEVLRPARNKFLEQTPTGHIFGEHIAMVVFFQERIDTLRMRERVIPKTPPTEPIDETEAFNWAAENLQIDAKNALRAAQFIDFDSGARRTFESFALQIDLTGDILDGLIDTFMAVPQLQIQHEGQGLIGDDQLTDDWHVRNIRADGRVLITREDDAGSPTERQVVLVDELLAMNGLSRVPRQATGVHNPEA